jgi:hypothetical protein
MPIRITVSGAKRASVKLGQLSVNIKNGAKRLSPATIHEVVRLVTIHDTRNFQTMQNLRAQSRISLPAAVFSRENNYINMSDPTIRKLEVKVLDLLPLADTQRLWKSVSNPDSPDIRVEVTVAAITIVNLVPYAPKHMTGVSLVNISVYDLFEFGALEQQRLLERVPPPPLKGTRKARGGGRTMRERGVVKGMKGSVLGFADVFTSGIIQEYNLSPDKFIGNEGDEGDLKSSRPYYRLYNWAKNRYPTSGALPNRNWVFPLPPEVVQRIGNMIVMDVVENTGL